MSEENNPTLKPNSLCSQCRTNLIHGARFKQTDPWMALEIAGLLTLVTLALKSNKYAVMYGNDIEGINRINCLGCYLPDDFKRIVKVAKETRSIEAVKALGDG